MFRFVILGLAGFGAYKLYEMLQPKAAQANQQFAQATDTARVVAEDVKQDVREATNTVAGDVRAATNTVAQDVRDDLREAGYTDIVGDADVRTAQ
jgi:hypothetical protein